MASSSEDDEDNAAPINNTEDDFEVVVTDRDEFDLGEDLMPSENMNFDSSDSLLTGETSTEIKKEQLFDPSPSSILVDKKLFDKYSTLKPRYLDITDAGAKEYFVVDGDSLIANFLCNPLKNMVTNAPQSDFKPFPDQWSPLQVTWLIERFLTELKLRSCNFDIVFFDCNNTVWCESNSHRFLLFRALTLRHLKRHFGTNSEADRTTGGDGVFVFPDWVSDDWCNFVSHWRPRFVMMTDGSSESLPEYAVNNDVKAWMERTNIWRAFILVWIRVLPVVLFDQMKLHGSHVTGFMIHSEGASVAKLSTKDSTFSSVIRKAEQQLMLEAKKAKQPFDHGIWNDDKIDSEATRLALMTLTAMVKESNEVAEFARLICITRAISIYAPLSCRMQSDIVVPSQKLTRLLDEFYKSALSAEKCLRPDTWSCDVCDFFDEKFFLVLITAYQKLESCESVGNSCLFHAQKLWDCICQTCGLPFSDVSSPNRLLVEVEVVKSDLTNNPSQQPPESYLNRLQNSLFADILKPVLPAEFEMMRLTPAEEATAEPEPMSYHERHHWHSMRELTSKELRENLFRAGSENLRSKRLRQEQKFMTFQHHYAESLLDTLGLYFKPIVMKEDGEQAKHQPKGAATSASAREIIAKNKMAEAKKLHEAGQKQLEELKKRNFEQERMHGKAFQNRLAVVLGEKSPVTQDPASKICLLLFELEHLDEKLFQCLKKSSLRKAISIKIDIYEKVKHIYEKFPIWRKNDSLWKNLTLLMKCIGFEHIGKQLREESKSVGSTVKPQEKGSSAKPGSKLLKSKSCSDEAGDSFEIESAKEFVFKFKKPLFSASEFKQLMGIDQNLLDQEFQMRYCGHLLNRNTGSAYDPRVGFEPDDWQRKLLDIVDRKESALVCAPTSSGKTFISFYAMEKVIKSSDSGIVVYVAPTKALVNQTAAEAYARFGQKKFGQCKVEKGEKAETVVGIYTRDYRHHPMGCQILICVPDILEILLLSPIHAKSWVPRLKRIIFDEVHVIGEMDGGQVWEHLLLLAPCPILALSATISNCGSFFSWLEGVQSGKGFKAHLVTSERRYCDLRKQIYMPSGRKTTFITSIRPKSSSGALVPVNPLATMSASAIAQRGFPTDFKLIPQECIDVYKQLEGEASAELAKKLQLDHLDPDRFFKDKVFLSKDDSDRYEEALKAKLTDCARQAPDVVREIIGKFDSKIYSRRLGANRDEMCMEFPRLISELAAEKKLPAIVFCLDRTGCMELAKSLCAVMEMLEKEKRRNDSEFIRKQREAIRAEELLAEEAKRNRKGVEKKVKKRSDEENERDIEPPSIFDWRQQDPDCTLVFEQYRVSKKDLKEKYNIDRVAESLPEGYRPLINALHRGIGVHHAGLPRKYREIVEMLFRHKHLSVVIATGTMALGIHAPCRSVVFAGDSVFLSSLNHRQMMGRAGRRGFDLIGDVIYFGMPKTKIYQLLSSPLSPLSGHLPVTTTLVLRTLCLATEFSLEEEPNSDQSRMSEISLRVGNQIKSLFCGSLFSMGREIPLQQILHQIRFSIEYLMREKLIISDGRLTNLAGLVQHMYYTEPSNLQFASLLESGLVEKVLGPDRTDLDSLAEDFLKIFANIFNRVPLPRIKLLRPAVTKTSSSIINLPELPEEIAQFLIDHNRKVIVIFRECLLDYVRTVLVTKQDPSTDDAKLPISNLRFPALLPSDDKSRLIENLQASAVRAEIRSQFSALSGHGDDFDGAYDMASHARAGIFLDESAIPTMTFNSNQLNAYMLDFFKHGQIRTIEKDNGIKEGESYHLLKDTLLLLKCIDTSLKETLGSESDSGYERLQAIVGHTATKFQERLYESERNAVY